MSYCGGVNKIIFEYCHSPKPYLKELEDETTMIGLVVNYLITEPEDKSNYFDFSNGNKDLAYGINVKLDNGGVRIAKMSVIKSDGKFRMSELFASRDKSTIVANLFVKTNERRRSMGLYPNTGYFGSDIRKEGLIQIYDEQAHNRCWIGY